ncbi:hypothetical protein V7S43_018969 [Phytophthora oleae]|uniref:Uncharacterized protein n=1 Tax=Phytophthora oleae TaxID=2107226 RepID=A0ABD3EPN7_9STRA
MPSAESLKRGAAGDAVGRPTKRVNRLMNLVWGGLPIITEEDREASRKIEQGAETNDDVGEEESAEEEKEVDTPDDREKEGDEEAKQDDTRSANMKTRRSKQADENDSDYNPRQPMTIKSQARTQLG